MMRSIANLPSSRFVPIHVWTSVLNPLGTIPTSDSLGRPCYTTVAPFAPKVGSDKGIVRYAVIFVWGDHVKLESYGDSRRDARRWLADSFVDDCILVHDIDELPFVA